jgi:hypothetical protein
VPNIHLGAIEVEIDRNRAQKPLARPKTRSAPGNRLLAQKPVVRPEAPEFAGRRAFWVQNVHLGAIEVENRQESRPKTRSAPRTG